MTKKGYQKRLPTVLPPTVPRPRAPIEDVVREEPPPPPPQPPQLAHLTPAQARPAPPRRPATAPVRRRRSPDSVVVGVGIALAAVLVAAGVNVILLLSDRAPEGGLADPSSLRTAEGPGVAPLAADESYVETVVQPDGEVVVHQWIQAGEPLRRLRLALPAVRGAEELSAARIEVVADGVVVDGPDRITGGAATFVFAGTTDVQVSYRLNGAVERSDSAEGRALALATSLDVTYEPQPRHETRVVRAPEVLALACSPSPEESFVPCGQAYGDDQWRIELTGPRIDDRVVAQLTLG